MQQDMTLSRKKFLRLSGLSASGLLLNSSIPARETTLLPTPEFKPPFGLASYTLREFDLDTVIAICQRLRLTHLSLKSMHMPLDSTEQQLKAIAAKIQQAGLQLIGAGVIYMNKPEDVDQAFTYAQHAGLKIIVAVPQYDLLPQVEAWVKKTNLKVAIHNHGPGDKLYASPDDIFARIRALDQRVGMCIDLGHVVRLNQNPLPFIERYKARLYDVHIKDVHQKNAEGDSIEIGRGVIDIPGILNVLKNIGYSGALSFEYEKDAKDPLPGLAESVGYVRGVLKMLA